MSHVPHHCTNGSPVDGCDDLRWLAYRYVSGDLSEAESAAFEERMAAELAENQAARGDVRLCELVAEVVEIGHAVRMVEAQAVEVAAADSTNARLAPESVAGESSRSVPMRRRTFAVMGAFASVAAACVAFVLGTRWNAPVDSVVDPNDPATVASNSGALDQDASRADRLVSLWRQSRDESADGHPGSVHDTDGDATDSDGHGDDLSWDSLADATADSVRSTSPAPGAAAGGGSVRWSSAGRSRDGDYVVPAWLLAAVSADEMNDGLERAVDPMSATLPKSPSESAPRSPSVNPVQEN